MYVEKKNSITNRAHLHDFHQPILSCQKKLLLIGWEEKHREKSMEDDMERQAVDRWMLMFD